MPIISATGVPSPSTTVNTFWVAANVMFDLGTGETKQILLLVNKVEDATVFTSQDAANYLNFVAVRAQNIIWTIEPLKTPAFRRVERFVIKGVQHV
jgi:hypothetical protein